MYSSPHRYIYRWREDNLNINMGLFLTQQLTNRNYTVHMTRRSIYDLDADERKAINLRWQNANSRIPRPDIFVSIHCNSCPRWWHGIPIPKFLDMPAVLVETAYLSNSQLASGQTLTDEERLHSLPSTIVNGIYDGIEDYLK